MSTKVGIQLEYCIGEEGLYDIPDTEWTLLKATAFGEDVQSVDNYVEALGISMLYTEFIHEHVIQEVKKRMRALNPNDPYPRITLAVVLEPWWEPDVDRESGIDEGGYCFEYLGLLKMEVQG